MKIIIQPMTITIPTPKITSWKTTLVGVLALILTVVQGSGDKSFVAAMLDFKVQIGLLAGLIALLSKDWNVTGGTSPATEEARARVKKQ